MVLSITIEIGRKSENQRGLTMAKILVVDDDKNIVSMIDDFMKIHNIETIKGYSGHDAVELSKRPDIDLIVLDINMDDFDGFEACKQIRTHSNVPIIFLTAKTSQADKILGLGIGGDDYLTKPFDPLELVARVKSNIRRNGQYGLKPLKNKNELTIGVLKINKDTHKVTRGNVAIDLSVTEYTLLMFLIENANRILTRKEILMNVWNSDIYADNTVNTYIMRLREKIEQDKNEPQYLITVRGEGYIFQMRTE